MKGIHFLVCFFLLNAISLNFLQAQSSATQPTTFSVPPLPNPNPTPVNGNSTPETKARSAVFVLENGRLSIYRLKDTSIRNAPLVQAIGEHSTTSFNYNGNGYPTPQIVNVPEFGQVGEKLILETPEGEKIFTDARWKVVPIITQDGYPLIDVHTRIELAAQDFGITTQEQQQQIENALLPTLSDGQKEPFGDVVDFNP